MPFSLPEPVFVSLCFWLSCLGCSSTNKQFFQGSAGFCSVIFMSRKFPDPIYSIAHTNSCAGILERDWDRKHVLALMLDSMSVGPVFSLNWFGFTSSFQSQSCSQFLSSSAVWDSSDCSSVCSFTPSPVSYLSAFRANEALLSAYQGTRWLEKAVRVLSVFLSAFYLVVFLIPKWETSW